MRAKQHHMWNALSLGVCYYPEQWDRSMWRNDLQRMKGAGLFTVRVGEFAWALLEPKEGLFDFSLFDAFLDLAEEEGMQVIFGTPTAAPPAWLTEKYPETLNCRIDGTPYRHGMRRHYNYNAPVYREKCSIITERIAAHFARRPCIVGWQIDNELNCETDEFYSEADTAAFRTFLRKKYGTLERLNAAWGTVVWSQAYADWKEVHVPRLTIHHTVNPHEMLDYCRFVSESCISFCGLQADILRKYLKPGDFITTNGLFGRLDNHRLTDETLDVFAYDSYPNFAFLLGKDPNRPGELNDRRWSFHLTEVRSVCSHFAVMEQQTGANGWNTRMEAPAPKPCQLMLWTMQSVAHGADYVSFFRWRTAAVGTEIHWQGILDPDNRDNRKLAEVAQVRDRTMKIRRAAGADYSAAVGLLRDYDNLWDTEADVRHRRLAEASEAAIFEACQLSHTPLDMTDLRDVTEDCELSRYRALFYPHPLILTEARAKVLRAYVEEGGALIIGALAGQKDLQGRCVTVPMPGLLAGLTGTSVSESTFIGPADETSRVIWNERPFPSGIWNDVLKAETPDTRILATHAGDYYAGEPALTERRIGKGRVIHFGGTFEPELTDALLEHLGLRDPFGEVIGLPGICELAVRENAKERWYFVLNYGRQPAEIVLLRPLTDADDDAEVSGVMKLQPFETKVFRESKA